MFTIAWQYLTGKIVAKSYFNTTYPEWPPDPDRVFQSLVASWGERGECPKEKQALEWLEAQVLPSISLPVGHTIDYSESVGFYVPVNSTEAPNKSIKSQKYDTSLLELLPENRIKSKRHFPSIYVGDSVFALIWESIELNEHRDALQRLCLSVNRIGHSSSLVRCWLSENLDDLPIILKPQLNAHRADFALRIFERGRLQRLINTFQDSIKQKKYLPPPIARQVGYSTIKGDTKSFKHHFEKPIIVLSQCSGRQWNITQTLVLTDTLRKTLIKSSESVSPRMKVLISGHSADGSPLQKPHFAYIPLSFVGNDYADGHIMGMGIVVIAGSNSDDDRYLLEQTMLHAVNDNQMIVLTLGNAGCMELHSDDSKKEKLNLQSNTWCADSDTWATVTPIVMDRMQHSRRSDPNGWAADQIAQMCMDQDFPCPKDIFISSASSLIGVPPCAKFPPLLRKDGYSRRHVHAKISFHQNISGPLLLGAGRYRGYGLCKPVRKEATNGH